MASEAAASIASGEQALAAGDWQEAKAAFEAALEAGESPEALHGLATALYWLADVQGAIRCQERAYSGFRRAGDLARAVMVAIEVSLECSASLGNHAAGRGWLGRAARIVDQHRLAPLEGWIALVRGAYANDLGDPRAAEGLAVEAIELARRFEDSDLELCALSELGAARVELGRVADGLSLLDEAMAGALGGEIDDLATVIYASCRTIDYCTRSADVKRAVQWIRAADDFNDRYGSAHIHATCRTRYGAVLFGLGRWEEAERELEAALRMSKTAEPALQAEALATLAELRLAQGRIDEAGRLLDGLEDHGGAAFALASLHAAHGKTGAAASLLARRLREVGEGGLGSAELLELLSEIEIEQGAAGDAVTRARRLAEMGEQLDSELLAARGQRALGRALSATGEPERAAQHVERALSLFARLELSLEVARSRLLLADVLRETGDTGSAVAAGRAALAALEELGASRDADRAAALLRSLGVRAARSPGAKGLGELTKREREILELLGEGLSNREIAERLVLSPRTVEHHVRSVLMKLDLSNRAEAAAYAVRTRS